MTPRQHRLRYLLAGGFHELAWTEWGPEAGAPVVCVHGLTRTGRDFDVLAEALAGQGRRVLCPDLPGRGASAWLPQPMLYTPPSYVVALAHLLARLDGPVDWVGTSLGGICGMMVAAGTATPVRRLVLNDIGHRIPAEAIARIAAYVKLPLAFDDIAALEAHLRLIHAPFGPLTDPQWRHLAETSARRLPDGRLALHYDPAIGIPFEAGETGAVELGAVWQRVTAPVLLLRGVESDILDPATAREMAARPGVELVEWAGMGHAPALMAPEQVMTVSGFLQSDG